MIMPHHEIHALDHSFTATIRSDDRQEEMVIIAAGPRCDSWLRVMIVYASITGTVEKSTCCKLQSNREYLLDWFQCEIAIWCRDGGAPDPDNEPFQPVCKLLATQLVDWLGC